MKDIEFVIDRLIAGGLFFFAGSGFSYAFNLPSAYAVLEHTTNAFLPAAVTNKEKNDICNTIQPEVFYESIIGMTNSYECLSIWRSLYQAEQVRHGVQCTPNFSHLFIVEYSYKNSLPIITTNFDSMFEQACDILNIKYRVVLPTESPSNLEGNKLSICKVHGSIQDNEGKYSPHALWTTMTQITKVNTEWIKYLNALMTNNHLCFVGYSGRDIDFFPYIAEFPKKSGVKKIIWINRFGGDHSDVASRACGAIRIYQLPSDLFKSVSDRVNIQVSNKTEQLVRNSGDIETLLSFLERSLNEKRLLTKKEKKLLYCVLLSKVGRYRDAHRLAIKIMESRSLDLSPPNKHLLLLTCARLSHEISKYESCRHFAERVLATLKNKGEYDLNAAIQASCLVSESRRMSIPSDIYFGRNKNLLDYLHVAFVVVHFVFSELVANIKMFKYKLKYFDLNIETQHELIEHRIRFYALIQSILGSPQRGWINPVAAFLIRRWDKIRQMSYQSGYSAGIANAGKFKYRLSPSEKTKSESTSIYALTTSATGTELVVRNEADQLLRDGKFNESRIQFIKFANMANKSGNMLNEIKGIMGFAYANQMDGKRPLLTDDLRKRLSMLVSKLEGRRWRKHFKWLMDQVSTLGRHTKAREMSNKGN